MGAELASIGIIDRTWGAALKSGGVIHSCMISTGSTVRKFTHELYAEFGIN